MPNPTISKEIDLFKGLRNDENNKHIPMDYFYLIKNFNYSDIGLTGIDKILMPSQKVQIGSSPIDGLFEYRFLDSSNVLQTQNIVITGGNIYKDILETPVLLKSGLTTGLISFAVFNDKLYIANGNNYVNIYDGQSGVVTEMGAPFAVESTSGLLNGTYSYKMTYVTAGGEEIIGSVSNSLAVTNKRIILALPIGYSGTLSRKIYRTTGTGTAYKLVTTIADNTTLTYSDNITDGSLGVTIPAINNELPKVYFLQVAQQKLIGAVVDNKPTQIFVSDTDIDVIDSANFLDISNYGSDNTPINGIGIDFDKVVVGTDKNIYLVNITTTPNTVIISRANVGIKNGYTVKNLPAFQSFPGGLMFVSNLNDVRVMSGLQALPVATSLDNVRTDNWAQAIRGTLENDLNVTSSIYAEFFNYRYHLVVNGNKYVFDIRTLGWTYHNIETVSYESKPVLLSILEGNLYNGQSDGWIEKEYSQIQYRDEDVEAYLESPYMAVSDKYNMFQRFLYWFIPTVSNKVTITITTDDNTKFDITKTFSFYGGVFDSQYFNATNFLVDEIGMDYKVFNINRFSRWIKYRLTNTIGNISLQKFVIEAERLANKE